MPTLLPPTVGERLSQCGTQVEVWGITPGADVTLEVDGVSQTVSVNTTGNTFTVPGLAPNAKVRAIQRKGPDQSDWSNVVIAESVALPPGPPAIEQSLPRCIQCIFAWGVAPGSKVEVLNNAIVVADGIAGRDGQACMTVKQPPGSAYSSRTTTCGVPSAAGQITVVDPPAEVPAPKILEPLFECQTVVQFQQLLPGAIYEVFVTSASGNQRSLGTFCACTPNMTVNVPHRFEPGDKVMAVGSMENDRWRCRVPGRKSAEVPAVPPDDRIKPVIEQPVWEGDPIILVTNQIEGGTIKLTRRASASATAEDDLGSRPSSQHPEVAVGPTLHADNVIRVMQKLCNVERTSDPVTVKGIPPDIGEPAVRKPVYACANIVIVDKVIPGATVWIWQVPKGQPGPVTLIGKRKNSPGSSVIVGAFPRPAAGNEVFAKQEISGKFSPPSARLEVEFRENIPPPTVIDPVRVGDTQVWCDDLLVGAHVRLFNTKMEGITEVTVQIGGGTATDTMDSIGVWATVPQFARITATQALCMQGRPSAEVRVRSAQPCDGAPPYDPGKWNDGGFHEQNNRCYNYACDLRLDNTAQPGGGLTKAELECAATSTKAASDGLIPCTTGRCHPCHHKVALVMAPGRDFHWYRLDSNGMWSHKPGKTPATNVDKSGNLISNPETANRGIYTQFCGYFCVYKPDVSI